MFFGFGGRESESSEEEDPLYYIDFVRYFLYLSNFFMLLDAFNMYADDFIAENKTHPSVFQPKPVVPVALTVMAVYTICMFHYDGVIVKLYVFVVLILLAFFSRWLIFGTRKITIQSLPYLISLVLAGIIILMVWMRCTNVVACGEPKRTTTAKRRQRKLRMEKKPPDSSQLEDSWLSSWPLSNLSSILDSSLGDSKNNNSVGNSSVGNSSGGHSSGGPSSSGGAFSSNGSGSGSGSSHQSKATSNRPLKKSKNKPQSAINKKKKRKKKK